ncbi:hypothetical protein [Tissierella praeacuta]
MKTVFIIGGSNRIGYYIIRKWLENGNYAAVNLAESDNSFI